MAVFLGQLSLVPYIFVPHENLGCTGQTLAIDRYTGLYALLGNRFGTGAPTDFKLPDLQGKEPITHLSYIIASTGFWPQGGSPPGGEAPFVGQLMLVPYEQSLVPLGWFSCDGRELKIDDATRGLFSLLGNQYGGDGKTTFKLPDLTKHVPLAHLHYIIAAAGQFPTANQGNGSYYIGQLLLVPDKGAVPYGFFKCDGQTADISQNPALYALIGTLFGGNGTTKFGLPDLRGKEPIAGLHYIIANIGIFPAK
jgi:microcystin-dependent protein